MQWSIEKRRRVPKTIKDYWIIESLKLVLKSLNNNSNIVKMYKDKEIKKNVKNICLSMCDVKVFLTFIFTEYGTVFYYSI
jgi:hypothetical protein